MRGIIIAGTHSGCGKTTVTLGIMAALKKKGLSVQPFKTGPDFIDAGLHAVAVGRTSRNLDQWMCGSEYVIDCFRKQGRDTDIAVIEGVMGMYDGEFSTASLARLLGVPVILVVDGYGMAESAGALVRGFLECGMKENVGGPDIRVAGVIFNRVASEGHYQRLKDSVRDVPVLGYLLREVNFEIPHRHLGLTTVEENPVSAATLSRLADTVLKDINIDAIITAADLLDHKEERNASQSSRVEAAKNKIAVARDKAFCFYYEDNLDMLKEAGAEIVFFSPLEDEAVPDSVNAVYIGGGYPEMHARKLSENTSMLASVRAWAETGKPLYAECGGLMYLSRGIHDFDRIFFPMASIFPFDTSMTKKPRLGYREIELHGECLLGNAGWKCRGHEFHYSEIVLAVGNAVPVETIYSVRDKNGTALHAEGFRTKNTLASYVHLHFGSNPSIAKWFAGLDVLRLKEK